MNKEIFITYFDINYLPQGYVLCNSLNKLNFKFTIYILCLDQKTFEILNHEKIKNVKLLNLTDFENSELKKIKTNRSKVEYYWTLTPWAIQWCLELNPDFNRVTYLDADLFFIDSPKEIFREFEISKKEVLITKHCFSPDYDFSSKSGKFCVQFCTFNKGAGEKILHEWRDNCMDWCFDFDDNGRYGDQKYLDDWPKKYSEIIHILKSVQVAQGPWNSNRFPYSDAIFFHFHGLKIFSENSFFISKYPIPYPTRRNIYLPYCIELKKSIKILEKHNYKIKKSKFKNKFMLIILNFYYYLKYLLKKLSLSKFILFLD